MKTDNDSKLGHPNSPPPLDHQGWLCFLIDPDDYETGAEKLNVLLSDEKLSASFENAALRTVRENFTAEKIIPQYEEIYETKSE